jgi:hypothetical protein
MPDAPMSLIWYTTDDKYHDYSYSAGLDNL